MKRIVYVCDKCGREIKETGTAITEFSIDGRLVSGYEKAAHLCPNCAKKFEEWLTDQPDKPFIPKPAPLAERMIKTTAVEAPKQKVDVGKIKALANAGWSQKAIAEEMEMSQGNISYHLAKIKKDAEKETAE